MIPAKIISFDPVTVKWPPESKPEPLETESMQSDAYIERLIRWLELPLSTIAEVENVNFN